MKTYHIKYKEKERLDVYKQSIQLKRLEKYQREKTIEVK